MRTQKSDFGSQYVRQVDLLLKILPIVAKESCFAIKGGTAINLFLRDLPRLSVDIDLVYLPLEDRKTSLINIEKSLLNIKREIKRRFQGITVIEKRIGNPARLSKLIVGEQEKIKIEPNEILRGTLLPPQKRDLSSAVESLFGQSVLDVPIVSIPDLYAGKICAALDRQHPRDLFDIHLLYQHEGLTDEIRSAFVVYLASADRPIHELLSPNWHDQADLFTNAFQGMTRIPIKYDELVVTRSRLLHDILIQLTEKEKQFLLSLKMGKPDYTLMPYPHLDQLPALRWKLLNIQKISSVKQRKMIDKLEKLLYVDGV
ncbi:MAG: nucleotidyl transferase AbiEii/AbiGii toxin family protein [Proteobacteria bacterium]|nr:nucleotidyl transferase AbiEii/AbiGii toxin family protein [Pseudomonadota bacterium]